MDENKTQIAEETQQVDESGLKESFYTVTPFSKYLAMVLFVAFPFIGLWVGLQHNTVNEEITNVDKETYLNSRTDLSESAHKYEDLTREVMSSTLEESCGFSDRIYASEPTVTLNRKNTKDFIIALPESMSLEWEEDEGYYVLKDLNTDISATVHIYNHDLDGLIARRMHSPSLKFEPFTNTWWTTRWISVEPPAKCESGDVPTTLNGDPIYISGDGDVGAFFRSYTVVFNSRLLKRELPYPDSVQFRVSGDGNAPNYEDSVKFQKILENIIDTIEPGVTKG